MRSPSRDNREPSNKEKDIISEYKKKRSEEGAPVSSGRGGLGNINRSRTPSTREPATIPIVHSTGKTGEDSVADRKDDIKDGEYHSTGRGDNANITTQHDNQSTGNGGAGKIVKQTT
jgi:hypothetical protein